MADKKKVSEIKEEMGYHTITKKCGNCVHIKSVLVPIHWAPGNFKEVNVHCALGGFTVKKTACCNKHEFNIYM